MIKQGKEKRVPGKRIRINEVLEDAMIKKIDKKVDAWKKLKIWIHEISELIKNNLHDLKTLF